MMLNFTSCQAQNADQSSHEISQWIAQQLDLPMHFVNEVEWETRRSMIDAGTIQVAWMCGAWYVKRHEQEQVDVLAAPIMAADRYQQQPVYFSDVLVRKESAFQTFADLANGRFAINEPLSWSGCLVVGQHLAQTGRDWSFFGSVVQSHGHLSSLEMILSGVVDAAAIDSMVLEMEAETRPELRGVFRPIQTLGPSPIPPWVAARSLPDKTKSDLQAAFATMHTDPEGRTLLQKYGYERFIPTSDAAYASMREGISLIEKKNLGDFSFL